MLPVFASIGAMTIEATAMTNPKILPDRTSCDSVAWRLNTSL